MIIRELINWTRYLLKVIAWFTRVQTSDANMVFRRIILLNDVFRMSDVISTLVTLTLEEAKVFVEHAVVTNIFSRILLMIKTSKILFSLMLHHINFYSSGLLIYYVELTLLQIVIIAVHECRLLHNRCISSIITSRRNFYCFAWFMGLIG